MTRVLKRFSHRYKENWVEIKINAFFVARLLFFFALSLSLYLLFGLFQAVLLWLYAPPPVANGGRELK